LYNAVQQFEEENEDATLTNYLSQASLSSDLDNLEEGETRVSLMTLHSAKGLEFPLVFLVGLEQGLFPNYRSMDDPKALEEERRLCYVGITRAQERLYLTYASERRLWGGGRESSVPSIFLDELPQEFLTGNVIKKHTKRVKAVPEGKNPKSPSQNPKSTDWKVGDRVIHGTFGVGQITYVLGSGNKLTLAIKFANGGQKILDPKITKLTRVES
jgi:DNA helicase-2/ATP-dependent DNA helicase PcrA